MQNRCRDQKSTHSVFWQVSVTLSGPPCLTAQSFNCKRAPVGAEAKSSLHLEPHCLRPKEAALQPRCCLLRGREVEPSGGPVPRSLIDPQQWPDSFLGMEQLSELMPFCTRPEEGHICKQLLWGESSPGRALVVRLGCGLPLHPGFVTEHSTRPSVSCFLPSWLHPQEALQMKRKKLMCRK